MDRNCEIEKRTDLVGDDVEFLLILALDVDGAVSSGEIDNAGALEE